VFVTDTVAVEESGRPRIHVVSVARLIAGAIEWSLDREVRKHEPTVVP
jgi:phosphoribosylpyrophosphate synthetase